MAKTTTITREYDREGRVVKETIVESGESAFPAWAQPPSAPYVYPTITTNPPYGGWPPGTITC